MAGFTHLTKRIALGWLIVIVALVGAMTMFYPVQGASDSGKGPGGVGNTDGTGALKLWLKAGTGVYSDDGCTSAAGDGGAVACWADQSGNGNNFTQSTAGYRPSFTTSGVNNQPLINFDGSSQYLEKSFTTAINTDDFTVYVVAHASSNGSTFRSPFASHCSASGYMFYATDVNNWNFWLYKGPQWAKEDGLEVDIINWHMLTGYYEGEINGVPYFDIDGTNYDHENGMSYTKNQSCPARIGAGETQQASPGAYFAGDIAEVIIYDINLSLAQRTLVNNYLSEKYNIAINGDKYSDGDPSYTSDVAGIGKDEGPNGTGASGGMIITDDGFLQDNGDYILIGHVPTTNSNTNSDLPSDGDWADGNNLRWSRAWYLSKTDKDTLGGNVDITFDISDSGMDGDFSGNAGNYRLLKRVGSSGQFTDIGFATSINGDQVLFDNVDTTLLGSYFTLGTVDSETSPTAVVLQGFRIGHNRNIQVAVLILLTAIVGVYLSLSWRRRQHRC